MQLAGRLYLCVIEPASNTASFEEECRSSAVAASRWQYCVPFDRVKISELRSVRKTNVLPLNQLAGVCVVRFRFYTKRIYNADIKSVQKAVETFITTFPPPQKKDP